MHPAFTALADSNHWVLLWPELSFVGLGLLLLGLSCFQRTPSPPGLCTISAFALLGQLALLTAFGIGFFRQEALPAVSNFAGLVLHNPTGDTVRLFFMLTSLTISFFAVPYFKHRPFARAEFYSLLLFVSAGLMLLVQSQHFILFFVALEFVTLGFYILISYASSEVLSLEAGLKYLVLGAFTSCLLLLGIALLYGLATAPAFIQGDGFYFTDLASFLQSYGSHPMAQVAVVCIVLGLGFKLGAFPFQLWVPDVYQGAPTPVTAFLATASKAGGFIALMTLIFGPFAAMACTLKPLLSWIAVLTLILSSITALTQRNMKRFLGLSGLSHTGYLLIGLVAAYDLPETKTALLFYLFAYSIGSFLVFGCLSYLGKNSEDSLLSLEGLELMHQRSPFLAAMLTVGLGSLAGVPPFIGFIAKFSIFIAVFKAKLYGLLIVSIFGVVLSIYYYFNWIRKLYFSTAHHDTIDKLTLCPLYSAYLLLLALLTVLWSFLPLPLSASMFQH